MSSGVYVPGTDVCPSGQPLQLDRCRPRSSEGRRFGMRETLNARLAAATGLVFVASIATVAIIGQAKDLKLAGDLALRGGNEVFGWTTLLTGVGAIALFWFASTFAARIRRLEGGSGRLATTVAVSGAFIAGTLALGISVAYAARSANSVGLGPLTTAIYAGPG